MLAMFFAERVILNKTKFSDVPLQLKDAVKAILVDSGFEYMSTEFVAE